MREEGWSWSFHHFADAWDVEHVLRDAPRDRRAKLLVWEYALLRSELRGSPRPDPREVALLEQQVIQVWPFFTAVRLVVLIAVFAGGSLMGLEALRDYRISDASIPLGTAIAALVLLAWRLVRLLGPKGRAMRLVWSARDRNSDERMAILRKAAVMDPDA